MCATHDRAGGRRSAAGRDLGAPADARRPGRRRCAPGSSWRARSARRCPTRTSASSTPTRRGTHGLRRGLRRRRSTTTIAASWSTTRPTGRCATCWRSWPRSCRWCARPRRAALLEAGLPDAVRVTGVERRARPRRCIRRSPAPSAARRPCSTPRRAPATDLDAAVRVAAGGDHRPPAGLGAGVVARRRPRRHRRRAALPARPHRRAVAPAPPVRGAARGRLRAAGRRPAPRLRAAAGRRRAATRSSPRPSACATRLPVALRQRLTERLATSRRTSSTPRAYVAASRRAADRAGLLACGDVTVAIQLAGGARGARRTWCAWPASRRYLAVRSKLRGP